jgi:thioredoxin-related protein
MNKLILPIVAAAILLSACNQNETKAEVKKPVQKPVAVEKKENVDFPYPTLLAENGNAYSLLVIGEDSKVPVEKNKNVTKSVKNILSLPTTEMAGKIYPELKIDSSPAYLLFDQNGQVYRAKSQKELSNYLKSHQK